MTGVAQRPLQAALSLLLVVQLVRVRHLRDITYSGSRAVSMARLRHFLRFYFHSVMVLMEFLVFGGVNLGLGSPTLRMLSAPLEALPVAT